MMFNQSKQFPAGMAGGDQQAGGAGGMFARLLGRNPMEGMRQGPMPGAGGGLGQAGAMISPQVPRSPSPPQADPSAMARIQQMARGGMGGGGMGGGAQPSATMPASQPAGQMSGQAGDIGMLLQRLLQARQQQGGVPSWLMQMMGRGQG